MDCRALYVRVKYLPPDAALWREKEEREDDAPTPEPQRIDTSDPNAIDDLWNDLS